MEDNKKPENPMAFPVLDPNSSFYQTGMTLRDYFAAKAMQSMMSNNEMWVNISIDKQNCTRDKKNDTMYDYVAQESYSIADAMLKERVK